MESINADDTHCIEPEDDQQLLWWRPISFYWKEEPAGDILSVILPRPVDSKSMWPLLQFRLIYPNSMFHRVLSHNHSIAFYGRQAFRRN
jgi:hypothetical protein